MYQQTRSNLKAVSTPDKTSPLHTPNKQNPYINNNNISPNNSRKISPYNSRKQNNQEMSNMEMPDDIPKYNSDVIPPPTNNTIVDSSDDETLKMVDGIIRKSKSTSHRSNKTKSSEYNSVSLLANLESALEQRKEAVRKAFLLQNECDGLWKQVQSLQRFIRECRFESETQRQKAEEISNLDFSQLGMMHENEMMSDDLLSHQNSDLEELLALKNEEMVALNRQLYEVRQQLEAAKVTKQQATQQVNKGDKELFFLIVFH